MNLIPVIKESRLDPGVKATTSGANHCHQRSPCYRNCIQTFIIKFKLSMYISLYYHYYVVTVYYAYKLFNSSFK